MLVARRLHCRAAQKGIAATTRRHGTISWETAAENRLDINKKSAGYWNVTISNSPTSMFEPLMFAELNVLVQNMAQSPELRIVVFESADPDFFMNHHDVMRRLEAPEVPGARAFFNN